MQGEPEIYICATTARHGPVQPARTLRFTANGGDPGHRESACHSTGAIPRHCRVIISAVRKTTLLVSVRDRRSSEEALDGVDSVVVCCRMRQGGGRRSLYTFMSWDH